MQSLVTSAESPYKDGTFPSGMNWEDYINWCLCAMFQSDNGNDTAPEEQQDDEEQQPLALLSKDQAVTSNEMTGLVPMTPVGYYFKGFLAWCLWGFIPVNDDTAMRSSLFSESKTITSYGRNTGSRRALKKQATSTSVIPDGLLALPYDDHRRGQKRKKATDERSSTPTTMTDVSSTKTSQNHMASILSKTLAFMDSQSTEAQLQQTSLLQVTILRDELAAIRRKSDKLSQRFFQMKDQGADPSILMRVDAFEVEIERLESELKQMQSAEVQRRTTAIATAQQLSADARQSVAEDDTNSAPLLPQGLLSFATSPPSSLPTRPLVTTAPTNECVCIECCVTSTTHKCRRCERHVCDLCCFNLRGLEMVWWCAQCFDNESLTTQNIIRDGNYNSDGENNDGRDY